MIRHTRTGVLLSSGAMAAVDLAFRVFCDRGETILTEQYTYPETLECAGLHGIQLCGVETDAYGLRPDVLDKILSSWDSSVTRPRVLYTIPTGQNPTGYTQPWYRRRAIYEIATKYDLIIIEDDPYFFHRMGSYNSQGAVNGEDDLETFHSHAVPSYLSLDTSGRVVRLDSTSNVQDSRPRTASRMGYCFLSDH